MAEEMVQRGDEALVDPVRDYPGYDETASKIGIWGHPLHAMSVAFPVALTFCAFGADGLYWLSGDLFWARAAVWAAGTAFLFGLLAGITGTAESAARPPTPPTSTRPICNMMTGSNCAPDADFIATNANG